MLFLFKKRVNISTTFECIAEEMKKEIKAIK